MTGIMAAPYGSTLDAEDEGLNESESLNGRSEVCRGLKKLGRKMTGLEQRCQT